jgi:hypothetical protein
MELRNHIEDGVVSQQGPAFPVASGPGDALNLARGLFHFILKISARHEMASR